MLRSFGQPPRVRNFSVTYGSHFLRRQGKHCDGFTVQRGEFHLVTCAVVMDQHDRANIATCEAVLGQIAFENYVVQFGNHAVFLFKGCAVTNRGGAPLLFINHTLRTFKAVPSAAMSSPSTT